LLELANLKASAPVQKRSKELMEQARHVLKERGDIHKLYQDDGLAAAAVNNQQGRRPGLDRKRARFSLKPPERQFTFASSFRYSFGHSSLWSDMFISQPYSAVV
jgi:hypothetical protein